MGVWENYETRMEAIGITGRDRAVNSLKTHLVKKIPNSPSWHKVLINEKPQFVSILNRSDDMAKKKICSMPSETLEHGGYVDYENSKWIITEIDASDEVYSSGIMQRCNYLLKWLNHSGKIIEKWCVVEDGTKYLIGEKNGDIITIGDARIAITLPKDIDTNELKRGKRFIVDDPDASTPSAYQITKSNKLYNMYENKGVFRFILNEVNLTDDDNVELRVADYYNWKPKDSVGKNHEDKDIPLEDIIEDASKEVSEDDDKGVWL